MKKVAFGTLTWLNPPPHHEVDGDTLAAVTGDQTDFWQHTFYGFVHDNGHFGFTEVAGDFSAEVSFEGEYEELYDHAGLMLRLDQHTWLKAGVEYTDGQQHLSVVVTKGTSDWSVLPLTSPPGRVLLRLTRLGEAVLVQYALDGETFSMLRLSALTDAEVVQLGVMCCSPKRAGFQVKFRDLKLGQPVLRDLHATHGVDQPNY